LPKQATGEEKQRSSKQRDGRFSLPRGTTDSNLTPSHKTASHPEPIAESALRFLPGLVDKLFKNEKGFSRREAVVLIKK